MKLSSLLHNIDNIRNDKVGACLKELRKSDPRKITQQQIADLCCVTVKTYASWEHGQEMPLSAAYSLSCFYGVSLDYLCGRSNYRTINGDGIGKLTGLSDTAVAILQQENSFQYEDGRKAPIIDAANILFDDFKYCEDKTDRNDSILMSIRTLLSYRPGERLTIDPGTRKFVSFNDIDATMAIFANLQAALLRLRDRFHVHKPDSATDPAQK